MTKSTITREQLLEIIETDHVQCGEASYLARMALAAMDSEPVAWTWQHREQWHVTNDEERARDLAWDGVKVEPLYRHAQPAPVVVPEGLNPETTDLVLRFASALADKLYKAEQKYGRSTDWMKDDWYDDCLLSLWEHIGKGDPRDVAAYCAFMWYHGWVTTDYDRNVQNACRAAMLQSGNSPAQNHGWIPVSERMPDVGVKVLCFPVKDEPIHATFNGQLWLQDVSWSGSDDTIDNVIPVSVTHWMPLPAAPQEVKGE
ncbi:TPA: DUF551 domain-containing protein [Klebsiella michiganensis]|uniref:DUF551 domain-containing protein n=2 Tax=Klebsiella michiganensis TaxID=1134687 RepID=UPI00249C71DB|nr:DUF551 domain-containing protein [Klebsiella michiganensis]MDI3223509.1 DUF551 domain-containing protein [Klebsiella michiganensis]